MPARHGSDARMSQPEKILLLGGTREASELATQLVDAGHRVITSLAGRTKEPSPVAGETRIGGFGGAQGLANYLMENAIDRLVDATHPFAKQISENARTAAKRTGVALEVRTRPGWEKMPSDIWLEVASLAEAVSIIPQGARVLLALGSQYIDIFSSRADVFFLVRMVDKPELSLALPNHEVIIGKPSTQWQTERDLLVEQNITHIVCRNSGGAGAYAKIEAAHHLGLPVIMVQR